MHEHVARSPEVACIAIGLRLAGAPNLQDELAVFRELENLIVVALPADPYVAAIVYENSVLGFRPVVAVAGPTPAGKISAVLVELEHRRSRLTALAY
jgi:hypothetical protein